MERTAPLGEPLSSLRNLANYQAITLKRRPQRPCVTGGAPR